VKLTELTGPNAAPFSEKSPDCNATTGENYNLSLVQSTHTSAGVGTLQKLLFGITPVLTILYDPKNNASGESHLSCLKVVATSEGEVSDPAPKKSDSTLGKSVWGWGLGFVLGFWIAYTSL
jgi:hypothetical protein